MKTNDELLNEIKQRLEQGRDHEQAACLLATALKHIHSDAGHIKEVAEGFKKVVSLVDLKYTTKGPLTPVKEPTPEEVEAMRDKIKAWRDGLQGAETGRVYGNPPRVLEVSKDIPWDEAEAQGLTPPANVQGYQDMANALVKLYVNFVLTDSEAKKARQRLLKQIVKELEKKK